MSPAHARRRRRPPAGDQAVPAAGAAEPDGRPAAASEETGNSGLSRDRRWVLRAGVLGGSAAALAITSGCSRTARATPAATATAAAAAAAAAAGAPAAALPPFQLFTQPDLEFRTLNALGSAGYGCAEVGEVVTAVNTINAQGASYQAYYGNFLAMAAAVKALADQELAAGHTASARSAYLRAATYYDLCLYFVLGTSARAAEAGTYQAMQRCWNQAARLSDPPFEAVRIPYGRTWLPGYLLRPDTRPVQRPTVILNNGQDSQSISLYEYGGAAAIERGYNALVFEGPGQGSMLFEQQIPLRPDWEHVITPVLDYLRSRPDVDPARIALIGLSLGGELVIRAAASEHRLAAVVADPGILDFWLSWPAPLRGLFAGGASRQQVNHIWTTDVIPKLDAVQRFTFAKDSEPFGRPFLLAARAGTVDQDLYDLGTTLMQFTCAHLAGQVTAPTLVTDYQDDQVIPAGQASQVYAMLHSRKQFHSFTAADGAQYHDAPMAPQTRNQVVFDWLDGIL